MIKEEVNRKRDGDEEIASSNKRQKREEEDLYNLKTETEEELSNLKTESDNNVLPKWIQCKLCNIRVVNIKVDREMHMDTFHILGTKKQCYGTTPSYEIDDDHERINIEFARSLLISNIIKQKNYEEDKEAFEFKNNYLPQKFRLNNDLWTKNDFLSLGCRNRLPNILDHNISYLTHEAESILISPLLKNAMLNYHAWNFILPWCYQNIIFILPCETESHIGKGKGVVLFKRDTNGTVIGYNHFQKVSIFNDVFQKCQFIKNYYKDPCRGIAYGIVNDDTLPMGEINDEAVLNLRNI